MAHPALRQAIIAVKPEYFSLSEREQERYRATMPAVDRFKRDQRLLVALFHIQIDSKEALNAAFDAFSPAQYLLYNRTVLAITDC